MAEEENLLVPLDQYLKVGIHIGTKFRTKYMHPFIYKVRPDGLSVLNVQKINERLALAVNYLSQYEPQDILVICRRENGHKSAKLFSKLTGIRTIIGRYPPGILTNSELETFTEAKLMLVVDPWPDKNAINDAVKLGIPIVAICDTNNESNNIDLVIPANNKGKRSLALIFYILTKEYLKRRGSLKNDEALGKNLDDFTPQ